MTLNDVGVRWWASVRGVMYRRIPWGPMTTSWSWSSRWLRHGHPDDHVTVIPMTTSWSPRWPRHGHPMTTPWSWSPRWPRHGHRIISAARVDNYWYSRVSCTSRVVMRWTTIRIHRGRLSALPMTHRPSPTTASSGGRQDRAPVKRPYQWRKIKPKSTQSVSSFVRNRNNSVGK